MTGQSGEVDRRNAAINPRWRHVTGSRWIPETRNNKLLLMISVVQHKAYFCLCFASVRELYYDLSNVDELMSRFHCGI
ncbi:hypothetical protein J6590_023027 [Homalodisca vitripennis]|nr:hypothetical protein J6590_023027 [Homalodisca vitripennis]